MKTQLAAVLLLVAAGCGAREAVLEPRSPVERRVMITTADGTPGGDVLLTQEDYLSQDHIPASPEQVLAVLPTAFTEIGLPEPEIDTARRLVVVQPYYVSRRVGNRRMSQLLECGRGPAGLYADSYRIRLSVVTQVAPDDDGTILVTRISATGQNTGGTSGDTRCTTKGMLEDDIVAATVLGLVRDP